MNIHWEESMKIGVPAIDEQHEELFLQFQKLSEAVIEGRGVEGIGKLLSYMKAYAVTHFKDEENLMMLYKYPGLEEQRKQHAVFKENIDNLAEMLIRDIPVREIAIKMDAALIRYFINHVRNLDAKMADFVKLKSSLTTQPDH